MPTGEYREQISADYYNEEYSDKEVRGREEMRWESTTEKIHGEFIDQLDFDELQNLCEREPVHHLRLSLKDFLQVLILAAILTGMVVLIAWL